jgi:hypothetical protein
MRGWLQGQIGLPELSMDREIWDKFERRETKFFGNKFILKFFGC